VTVNFVIGEAGTTTFPPDLGNVAVARKWVRTAFPGYPVDFVDNAELLTSEIVANAIRHGRGKVTLTLARKGHSQRFEVYDEGSDTEPTIRVANVPDGLAEGGWGLQLLELLASSWDTICTPDGARLVWYELPLISDPTPEHQNGSGSACDRWPEP
jgi:anti-sigma regulatory factor (Ser/Thr protein kinase)